MWLALLFLTHAFTQHHSAATSLSPLPNPRARGAPVRFSNESTVGGRGSQDSLIETLDPCGSTGALFVGRGDVRRDYLREVHHFAFGRAWGLGRDVSDHLIRRGLLPSHTLLDFGCGALRNGIWLIRHLDAGHYYGVERDRAMYDAGRTYEVALNGLQAKAPNLYHNADGKPGLEHFGF